MRNRAIEPKLVQAARHFSYSSQVVDGVGSEPDTPNEDDSSCGVFYQDEQGDVASEVEESFRDRMWKKIDRFSFLLNSYG
jgi:hypothetical protein